MLTAMGIWEAFICRLQKFHLSPVEWDLWLGGGGRFVHMVCVGNALTPFCVEQELFSTCFMARCSNESMSAVHNTVSMLFSLLHSVAVRSSRLWGLRYSCTILPCMPRCSWPWHFSCLVAAHCQDLNPFLPVVCSSSCTTRQSTSTREAVPVQTSQTRTSAFLWHYRQGPTLFCLGCSMAFLKFGMGRQAGVRARFLEGETDNLGGGVIRIMSVIHSLNGWGARGKSDHAHAWMCHRALLLHWSSPFPPLL